MLTRLVTALVSAALVGGSLAACAGEPADPGGATPTPTPTATAPVSGTGPASALPSAAQPTPPSVGTPPTAPRSGQPRSGQTQLRGEVVAGVEADCVVMRTDRGEFLLLGEAAADIPLGTVVTVRGTVRRDLATTCQQGVPFEVTQVVR